MVRLRFSTHAIEQMAKRNITTDDVRHVLATGEIIRTETPANRDRRQLVLGWFGTQPMHVLYAESSDTEREIITAYRPKPELWDAEFKVRIR